MFAKYVYNWAQTPSGLIADVVSLLTGTTDKNLLSAGCNKGLTTITSTTPAGWSLHCAAVNGDSRDQVVKSQNLDGSWKFLRVRYTGAPAGWFFATYDTFNPVTFVGTGELTYTSSVILGGIHYLNLYATPTAAVVSATRADYNGVYDVCFMCLEYAPLSAAIAPVDPALPRYFATKAEFATNDAVYAAIEDSTHEGWAPEYNLGLRINKKYRVRNYLVDGPPSFEYATGDFPVYVRSIKYQGLADDPSGAYIEDVVANVNGAPVKIPDLLAMYPYPANNVDVVVEGVTYATLTNCPTIPYGFLVARG